MRREIAVITTVCRSLLVSDIRFSTTVQHAAVLAPAIVRNLPLRFFLSPSDKFPLKMAGQTSIWHSRNIVYKI